MSENKKINLERLDKEAYETLVEWAKSAPKFLEEIKEHGNEEDLLKFKTQVKMVVNKLKEIEQVLKK